MRDGRHGDSCRARRSLEAAWGEGWVVEEAGEGVATDDASEGAGDDQASHQADALLRDVARDVARERTARRLLR